MNIEDLRARRLALIESIAAASDEIAAIDCEIEALQMQFLEDIETMEAVSHRLREQLAEDFRELAQMSEAEKDYYSGQDRRRHD